MGSSDTIQQDRITWSDLLNCLNHNKSLDVLGDDMLSLKSALDSMSANVTYGIKKNSDGTISLVSLS
jgi:hypothetical protein